MYAVCDKISEPTRAVARPRGSNHSHSRKEERIVAASSLHAEIRASKKPYYVYILSKPDGTPFYVGLGCGRRVFKHEWDARKSGKNVHRLNIIRQIRAAGGEVGKAIDSWHDDLKSASDREIALIASIGRQDLGTGPLVNQTSGGNFTWKLGPAGRKAASRRTKQHFTDPLRREKQRQAIRQYFQAPEARAKASEAGKLSNTPAKIAKCKRGRQRFRETRPLIVAAHERKRIAVLQSPETKAKMSASATRYLKEHPERLEELLAAAATPEAKQHSSEAQKRRFAKPEERAKAGVAAKTWMASRIAVVATCERLMSKHGIAPPSRKASLADWNAFEAKLRALTGDYENG